jgi:hypothetical protein
VHVLRCVLQSGPSSQGAGFRKRMLMADVIITQGLVICLDASPDTMCQLSF